MMIATTPWVSTRSAARRRRFWQTSPGRVPAAAMQRWVLRGGQEIAHSKNDQLDANGSLPVCTFCCFLHFGNTHDLRNNTTIRSTRWFIQPGGLNLWCSNQQWTCPQVSTCGNTHSLGLIIPACPYSDQIQ